MTKSKGIQQPSYNHPVFGYGSLRVGGFMYKGFAMWRRKMKRRPIARDERCMVEGFELWDATEGKFPHAVETGRPGAKVVGDVLWLSNGEYEYVEWVELGAGYQQMLVEVTDGAGVKIKADMFYAGAEMASQVMAHGQLVGADWVGYQAMLASKMEKKSRRTRR